MKQIIFTLITLFLSCNLSFAQDKAKTPKGKAIISCENAVKDFKVIQEKDGKVSHTFVIKNTGNGPLVLTRVIASCGCTSTQWTKEPIAPGKTGNVKVTYDPKNRPGQFYKTISIYSNGKRGSFLLGIRGEVKR